MEFIFNTHKTPMEWWEHLQSMWQYFKRVLKEFKRAAKTCNAIRFILTMEFMKIAQNKPTTWCSSWYFN